VAVQAIFNYRYTLKRGLRDDLALLTLFHPLLDLEVRTDFTFRELLMATLLKVRNKSGHSVRFVLNDAQKEIDRNWSNRNIILKARQLGITTYVAARFFIDTVTRPGTLTVQVAHDQRSAEDIFRIVHRFQENLPEPLQKGALKTSRANTRQLVWQRLDSEYRVETAADPNAGRGTTIRNLHCSEVARWMRDGAEALTSLRAAVPPGGQIVLESTPNGASGPFYSEWQRAGETGFVRHFLPWWLETAYRVPGVAAGDLNEDEAQLQDLYGLDDEQIVYRRQMKADHRRMFAQEFAENAEDCFIASGNCLFDIDIVEERLKTCAANEDERAKELTVFMPPQKGRQYIIGVDPAGGGIDGDYGCAEIIDRTWGIQCAELHGHFQAHEFAKKVVQLAREYNNAFVVVERNGLGLATLEHIVHTERYPHLYCNGRETGFNTNSATRPALLETLGRVVHTSPTLFSSTRFLRECRTFVRQENGSPRAAAGSHDDTVMAMALAHLIRDQGHRSGTTAVS
jgi:hypothetical protein